MVQIGKFNPGSHEPEQAFDPLPAGWYPMSLISAEVRKTKDQQNQYLWLEFEVLENERPDLKGRRAWERLNLWHSKPQTVDIAQKRLSGLCRSCGVMAEIEDTDILIGKPVAVKLKVRQADGNFEASNEVTGFDAHASRFGAGAPVPAGQMGGASVAPPPSAATGAAPAPAVAQTPPPPATPGAPPAAGQPAGQAPWKGGQ